MTFLEIVNEAEIFFRSMLQYLEADVMPKVTLRPNAVHDAPGSVLHVTSPERFRFLFIYHKFQFIFRKFDACFAE